VIGGAVHFAPDTRQGEVISRARRNRVRVCGRNGREAAKVSETTRTICAFASFPSFLHHQQTRTVNTHPSPSRTHSTLYYDEHAVAPITTTPPIVRENMVIDCLAKRPTDYANHFHAYRTKITCLEHSLTDITGDNALCEDVQRQMPRGHGPVDARIVTNAVPSVVSAKGMQTPNFLPSLYLMSNI
jgi:hypothetical protein